MIASSITNGSGGHPPIITSASRIPDRDFPRILPEAGQAPMAKTSFGGCPPDPFVILDAIIKARGEV